MADGKRELGGRPGSIEHINLYPVCSIHRGGGLGQLKAVEIHDGIGTARVIDLLLGVNSDIEGQDHTALPGLFAKLFDKVLAAKNFQSGMMMERQLEFALFDFHIHADYDPDKGARIQETLNKVRDKVAVINPPPFNRFQHSFSHIFAGGYAAGYYSYKWAEVLSADAFAKFEENGIFDTETGQAFLHNVLEKGGSREPMELFVAFRGREPEIDALLRHSGIAA